MTENRYAGLLREHNQAIIALGSPLEVLKQEVARTIKRFKKNAHMLEIGCGDGSSIEPVLAATDVYADLVDESQEMLNLAAGHLRRKYLGRTAYFTADALEFMEGEGTYDVIMASFVIHNFPQAYKDKLFAAIRKKLQIGGMFILHDVIPDGDFRPRLKRQIARYKRNLDADVAAAIVAHVQQDMTDEFRMDQEPLVRRLCAANFSRVSILDRIECDAIVAAYK